MRLADAMNTWNPALLTLQLKGYSLRTIYDNDSPGNYLWVAAQEGHEFIADDPLRLLGLVAMWEVRGDDWQRMTDEEPDLVGQLLEVA